MIWLGIHQVIYDLSCFIFDKVGIWKTLRYLRYLRRNDARKYAQSAWYQAVWDGAIDTYGEIVYDWVDGRPL